VIAACCFVLCFTGLGFFSGNKGLFLAAVTEALGIPRSVYAVSDSLRYIATAVTNLCFDIVSTYRPVFFTYSVLMIGVTAGFLLVHKQVAITRAAMENAV